MVLNEAKIRDESELEALLVKDPNQIEEGFKIITHQRTTSGLKSLDILGVDSGGRLTLIELKVIIDVNQLRQALEYYDWLMMAGIDWVSDAYKEKLQGTKIKEQMPQIFLIAPDFDDKMINEAKYIHKDINVRLFRYLSLEINGNKEIKLLETSIPQMREIEAKPMSIKDNINYIIEKDVQSLFRSTMERIKSIDEKHIEEKVANYVISYWISGKKFCDIYPKKKYFNVGYKTDETEQKWDWKNNILEEKQINEVFENKIKKAYELMKKGF